VQPSSPLSVSVTLRSQCRPTATAPHRARRPARSPFFRALSRWRQP
jgi:hypothetical protein